MLLSKSRRRFVKSICSMAAATILMVAGPTNAETSRTLHIGNAGEPQTLDPHRYNLRLEETLLNDLFLGLTTFNSAGEIVPGAAQSWTTSEDGLTWTFNLKPGLKWSDGTPLTATDFVYSLQRLQDPNTAASLAYFMYMLKNAAAVNKGTLPLAALGVHATDDLTLVMELHEPYPYLPERLLYPTAFPVPRHIIEAHGDNWIKPANWVSNGAYILGDWQPQTYVDLHKNPHFKTQPSIDTVRYYPVVNEQSAYNRFRNNELDVIGSFPVGELTKVKDAYPDALQISDLLSMMYLVFNVERAPFNDVRVRQALSLAVDQSILTEKVVRSGNAPAYSFAPHLLQDYSPAELPHARTPLRVRQQQARALLAEAGYTKDNPLRLTLRHVTGMEGKKVNLAVTGMWRQIGVLAQLHQAELRSHFGDLRQGNFDVAWAGWVGESNAEHYLSLLQSDTGDVNYGRYKNTAFDTLMRQAKTKAVMADRNAILGEAELTVVNEYPVIPLYTVAVRRLVNPELKGWLPNARDMHQIRYLSWQDRGHDASD